ncbi:MAG: DUF3471 domain-containing protein [Candidatus Sulfotelmatobacter sp.]
MLCIFDQTMARQVGKERRAAFRLLADGALSMVRQWARIQCAQEEANAAASTSATPVSLLVFRSLPNFKPSPGAMIYGAALSVATFSVVFFAMRYSLTHRAAIVLPVESYASDSSTSSAEGFRIPSAATVDNAAEARPRSRFESQHTTPPLKPETVTSAPASEGGINATSGPAGIARPFQSKAGSPARVVPRKAGEYAPDISSAANRPNTSTSPSRVEAVAEPVSAEWIKAYAGTYVTDTSAPLEITVSTRDGQLEIEIDGQGKIAAVAASQTQFILMGKTDAWIEFVTDQDGAVRELALYRDGERQTAHRRQ